MFAFFLLLEILFIQGYFASHSLPYTPTIDKDSITVGGFSSGACFATQVPTYFEIKILIHTTKMHTFFQLTIYLLVPCGLFFNNKRGWCLVWSSQFMYPATICLYIWPIRDQRRSIGFRYKVIMPDFFTFPKIIG